jgi:hypothetical protein
MGRVSFRRALLRVGLLAGIGLSAAVAAMDLPQTPEAAAMSCFAVGTALTCIDVNAGPLMPAVPPPIIPIGPHVEGERQSMTIRDDGGHEVARG